MQLNIYELINRSEIIDSRNSSVLHLYLSFTPNSCCVFFSLLTSSPSRHLSPLSPRLQLTMWKPTCQSPWSSSCRPLRERRERALSLMPASSSSASWLWIARCWTSSLPTMMKQVRRGWRQVGRGTLIQWCKQRKTWTQSIIWHLLLCELFCTC